VQTAHAHAPLFEVSDGPHVWLTQVQAVGLGNTQGETFTSMSTHSGEGASMNGSLQNVHGEFLFRMVASAAVGERLKVSGPSAAGTFSTATGGGRFEGPRLQGRLLEGFAWAPHTHAHG